VASTKPCGPGSTNLDCSLRDRFPADRLCVRYQSLIRAFAFAQKYRGCGRYIHCIGSRKQTLGSLTGAEGLIFDPDILDSIHSMRLPDASSIWH
jgi:hypothetical protein